MGASIPSSNWSLSIHCCVNTYGDPRVSASFSLSSSPVKSTTLDFPFTSSLNKATAISDSESRASILINSSSILMSSSWCWFSSIFWTFAVIFQKSSSLSTSLTYGDLYQQKRSFLIERSPTLLDNKSILVSILLISSDILSIAWKVSKPTAAEYPTAKSTIGTISSSTSWVSTKPR